MEAVGIGLLSLLYLYVAYLTRVPEVSEEYRAYYIDRSTSDWRPARYSAPVESGVDFSREGYPDFLRYTRGLSGREEWGRWTDARLHPYAELVFDQPFFGAICVSIKARAAGKQGGKVARIRLGDSERSFVTPGADWSLYVFDITLERPASSLEIHPSAPSAASPSDRRLIALGLRHVRVVQGPCS